MNTTGKKIQKGQINQHGLGFLEIFQVFTQHALNNLWPFRFVAVFGLWPFRFVAIPVCGRSGLWPFRFVAF